MKLRRFLTGAALIAALCIGFAAAAGGGGDDPLISLDYLTGSFSASAEKQAQARIDAAGKAVYDAAAEQWQTAVAPVRALVAAERVTDWTEATLKHGDILTAMTGTQVLLLDGAMSVQYADGAVVDATEGTVLPSGGELAKNHRYIAAEDTAALFTVVSRTAVVDYCGVYSVSLSTATPDYGAMASALKALHLFRGGDTGYGQGFDLEKTPTRIQTLVMLIRLLGEEDAALAFDAPASFTDTPADYWGAPYVAYAESKGYTNGVGGGLFGPERATNAQMYVEFVLRALGYSSTAETDVTTAPARALAAGVITAGEKAVLEAAAFQRADIVYLSWYALEVRMAQNMEPLHGKLEDMGVFTAEEYRSARALVTSARQ